MQLGLKLGMCTTIYRSIHRTHPNVLNQGLSYVVVTGNSYNHIALFTNLDQQTTAQLIIYFHELVKQQPLTRGHNNNDITNTST